MDPTSGFGLAHLKTEGAPVHPDDVYCDAAGQEWADWYARQLKAYNKFHGIPDEVLTVQNPVEIVTTTKNQALIGILKEAIKGISYGLTPAPCDGYAHITQEVVEDIIGILEED